MVRLSLSSTRRSARTPCAPPPPRHARAAAPCHDAVRGHAPRGCRQPAVPLLVAPGRMRAQAKTTKKITLRLTCTVCKTVRLLAIKRTKHFEITEKKAKAKGPSF